MIKLFYKIIPPSCGKRRHYFYCCEYREKLLPILIREVFGWDTGEYTISHTKHGKPFFSHSPEQAFFNISHTDGLWICALSDKDIGADIEKIGKPRLKLAEYMFSPADLETLHSSATEEIAETFFRIWTAKEACGKYTGEGISKKVLSELFVKDGAVYSAENGGCTAFLTECPVMSGYLCTVCTGSVPEKPEIIPADPLFPDFSE